MARLLPVSKIFLQFCHLPPRCVKYATPVCCHCGGANQPVRGVSNWLEGEVVEVRQQDNPQPAGYVHSWRGSRSQPLGSRAASSLVALHPSDRPANSFTSRNRPAIRGREGKKAEEEEDQPPYFDCSRQSKRCPHAWRAATNCWCVSNGTNSRSPMSNLETGKEFHKQKGYVNRKSSRQAWFHFCCSHPIINLDCGLDPHETIQTSHITDGRNNGVADHPPSR